MANDTLLAAAKRKLNITWSDTETDARVSDAIGNALPALARAIGLDAKTDAFDEPGEARGLLLNCIFYEFNDALDDFWANYADDVQRLLLANRAGVDDDAPEA